MAVVKVGSAQSSPGEIVKGWLDAVALPTGGYDRFPVIIAQGKDDSGPVFWVTASIHGGEHTGLIVAQQLITPDLLENLRGTLVVIPTLNPAGLRTKERSPYYHRDDPNRLFPEVKRSSKDNKSNRIAFELEEAYQAVYDAVEQSGASYLFDLHNAQIGSLPMVFRDPILYSRGRGRGLSQPQAKALQKRVGEMLEFFGFTVINEFVADSYVEKRLHRSVSGSILNGLGIPAVTVELGSWMHVDAGVVNACLAGLRNVLRWVEMLPGEMEPVEGIPVIQRDYSVRRSVHPHAPKSGVIHHLVRVGEDVKKGQSVARLTDIFGSPVGAEDGLIRSEFDGFVLGWRHGVIRYKGESVMVLAVRDDSSLIVPYPQD